MRTFKDVCKEDKEANNGFLSCDLSNFRSTCHLIQKKLESNELERATDEMYCLTSLFEDATDVNYSKYRINTGSVYDRKFKIPQSDLMDSKSIIENDFNRAKEQIETFICQNYKSGNFEITKEVLELPYWCIDWHWYNETNRRFIDACREANKLVGYNGDEESTKYYEEDKEIWNFEEIFCSHYNGGRVRASFKNIEDCLQWSYHGEAIKEDGLYWAEEPAY